MKIKNDSLIIDGIDKIILRQLMKDERKPILEIARKAGISGAAIHQRLRKLEKSGVLTGSKFIVDPKVLGYHTMTFTGAHLDNARTIDGVSRTETFISLDQQIDRQVKI